MYFLIMHLEKLYTDILKKTYLSYFDYSKIHLLLFKPSET